MCSTASTSLFVYYNQEEGTTEQGNPIQTLTRPYFLTQQFIHQQNILDEGQRTTDVNLICSDGFIPAHTAILQAVSPFFDKIFTTHGHHPHHCHTTTSTTSILLPDYTTIEIGKIIDLIYNGKTSTSTKEEADSIQITLIDFQINISSSLEVFEPEFECTLANPDPVLVCPFQDGIDRMKYFQNQNDSLSSSSKKDEDVKPVGDEAVEVVRTESSESQTAAASKKKNSTTFLRPRRENFKKIVQSDDNSSDEDYNDDEETRGRKRLRRRRPLAKKSSPKPRAESVRASPAPATVAKPSTSTPGPSSSSSASKTPSSPSKQPTASSSQRDSSSDSDVDDPSKLDMEWYYKEAKRCQYCNKQCKAAAAASICLTSHSRLRCYYCFKVVRNTEKLFQHFSKKHKQAGRENCLLCQFCEQTVPYKSVSCHVISMHLQNQQQQKEQHKEQQQKQQLENDKKKDDGKQQHGNSEASGSGPSNGVVKPGPSGSGSGSSSSKRKAAVEVVDVDDDSNDKSSEEDKSVKVGDLDYTYKFQSVCPGKRRVFTIKKRRVFD